MDLGIAGKRAVVIGGSSGLGLAISQRLAQEGVNLLIFARNPDRLGQIRKQLARQYGVSIETFAGNIGSQEDTDRLRDECSRLGGAEILVLNTPRPPSPMRDFLEETDQGRWDTAYQDQLHGALLILRKLAPLTTTTGWGRIVAITSASVKQPLPRHAVSTIFRAGVQAALKHLAPHSVCRMALTAHAGRGKDHASRSGSGRAGFRLQTSAHRLLCRHQGNEERTILLEDTLIMAKGAPSGTAPTK